MGADEPPTLEVGHIGRPHGLQGEVVVRLTTNRLERLAPGSSLYTDRGPLRVRSSRQHKGGHVVAFDDVTDRDGAARLNGTVLRAEPLHEPGALWAHELVGSVVVDGDGRAHGTVDALQENPASDLLVLDTGALVPVMFIVEPPVEGRIVVDVPPGLFEL